MAVDGRRVALPVVNGQVIAVVFELRAWRRGVVLLPWCNRAARIARRGLSGGACAGRDFRVFTVDPGCAVVSLMSIVRYGPHHCAPTGPKPVSESISLPCAASSVLLLHCGNLNGACARHSPSLKNHVPTRREDLLQPLICIHRHRRTPTLQAPTAAATPIAAKASAQWSAHRIC